MFDVDLILKYCIPYQSLLRAFPVDSMSNMDSYKTVLVTGANSFYAAAIMDKLVKDNVKIHAAVRSKRAALPLEERYGDAISVFIVYANQ